MSCTKFSILVRNLSTTNVANQLVKPPISVFGIDGRYATALYSAASKQKTLDAVEKELVKFQQSVKTDAKLLEFLQDPSIKRQLKAEGLKAIAGKLSMSPQTSNLLQVLAENGRLKYLNNVINAFKTIMSAHRGEVVCEVTTARELDANQRSQLETALKAALKSNQTLHLTTKVDSSIIGGMIVSIGDRYVDMSISSKVKRYSELISSPV